MKNHSKIDYEYDKAGGLLDRILSNGAITHYGWDAAGRLTQLKNTTLTGGLVNDTQYSRDRLGNILSQTETNALGQATGTTNYSYDPEYRLKTADYPGTAFDEAFSYDKVGNRKTHTLNGSTKYYNYNAGNRLQDIRTGNPTGTVYESYSYDANGSLTNVSGNRNLTLTWDANNRVKQINSTQYRYDPSGYRIQKAAGQTNRYYLEGEHLEAVYDGNGALRDQYLRGTVIDEVVNGYHRDANNVMVNSTYHHDALQSVLGQSAHDGQIQSTQSYTAFGGNLSGTGNSNAAQKYTGREADGESGFYYYRARYYDPATGRFISEDPKGFDAGINFYAYVNNNPVNANDPTGNCPWCIGATIGGLAGGVASYNAGARGWDLVGAATAGAVGGALGTLSIGAITSTSAILSSTIAGGIGGSAGNFAGQVLTGTPVDDVNYNQVLTQGVIGALSSEFGFIYASTTSRVVASAVPALAASTGGAINTLANLFVPTSLGGFSQATSNESSAANGGFVLYPNKANTNQMQSVYSKP